MEINKKFLDELEQKIKGFRKALRRKEQIDNLPNKIQIDVPFFNKQIDYTITQEDKDKIEQDAIDKRNALKTKIDDIDWTSLD